MSDILQDREYWDRQASRDPLWAILSEQAKRDGKWDVASFFQTGATEIASMLYELEAQNVELRRGAALDFGCGVGRLTQALASHFERVVGVDVSPRMQALASRLNQHPSSVRYVCNQTADLAIFEDRTFDFIVSSIVLQHIQPETASAYVREFLRVLAPGGVAIFQLPSHRRRSQHRPLESIARPMPDDAYRASLSIDGLSRALAPGAQVTVRVVLTNTSLYDWPQREYGVFSVGDHWLDGSGTRMLARDDGRTRLPAILRAGDTCSVALTINAPTDRGEYHCEFDVAHEGVLWFHDRGSPVVRIPVRVGASGPLDAVEAGRRESSPELPGSIVVRDAPVESNKAAGDPGEFPMYGVALDAVVALIHDAGTMLLHIENDRSCGDDWVSYRYVVRAGGPG